MIQSQGQISFMCILNSYRTFIQKLYETYQRIYRLLSWYPFCINTYLFVLSYYYFQNSSLPLESSIEIVLITILVMLIYQMVNRILSVEKENYLVKLNNEELKFNKKNYENIITHMNEIRKIKHDMNHMLLSLLEDCEKKIMNHSIIILITNYIELMKHKQWIRVMHL